jgi:hypothetical protein
MHIVKENHNSIHLPGIFFPYATGRGVAISAILTLILGHWICIGGLMNRSGPLEIAAKEFCGMESFVESPDRLEKKLPL